MNPNSYCLIMAGGIGNRFWPVSNRRCPKQFSDILHCGKSFIRQTYERISQIFPNHRIFIITGEEYEDIIKRQIIFLSSPEKNMKISSKDKSRKYRIPIY